MQIRTRIGLIGLVFLACSSVSDAQTDVGELLADPGFEGAYGPIPVSDADAIVTGVIPKGWSDSSTSSDVTVKYIKSDKLVHSGKAAVEIDLKSTGGTALFGQFVDGLVAGQTYKYGIWSCSTGSEQFEIGVRQKGVDSAALNSQSGNAEHVWHETVGTFVAPVGGSVFFYIKLSHSGIALFDDASLAAKASSL